MLRLLNQIRAILYPAEKYRLIFISVLVFFSDLLELCGLGLIMPVIALFLNPELFEQNTYLVYIRNFTGSLSNNSLMILLCMVCALFFVAKNILLYLIALLQTRFAYTLSARLGSELLKRYIEGDYRFHLKGTTGGMVEKLQQTRNVIPHFISALMMLSSEAALVLLILVSVFILAPYSALGIAVSGAIFSVPLLLFMRKMVQHLAALTFERAVKLNSFILFTANALKEIKLANRCKPFVREGHKLEYGNDCRPAALRHCSDLDCAADFLHRTRPDAHDSIRRPYSVQLGAHPRISVLFRQNLQGSPGHPTGRAANRTADHLRTRNPC